MMFLPFFNSFGVVVAEMCTRQLPFHELDYMGPNTIVNYVARVKELDPDLDLQVTTFFILLLVDF